MSADTGVGDVLASTSASAHRGIDDNNVMQRILTSIQALAADVQYIKEEVAGLKASVRESSFDNNALIRKKLKSTQEALVEDMMVVGEVMRKDVLDVSSRLQVF